MTLSGNSVSPLLDKYDPLDIDQVRKKLIENNEQAVGHLCWAGLDHASDAITHTDEKILQAFDYLKRLDEKSWVKLRHNIKDFASGVGEWVKENPWKCVFMLIGLGASAYKSKAILQKMKSSARGFTTWGQSVSTPVRFLGFCALMIVRLIVSTLVPPTSPAFGIILQVATPESEKWTAMPLFLAATTVAGAAPYIMDKIMEFLTGEDFKYTEIMRWFASDWPLTCWTAPTMKMVFRSTGGGKLGASMAVIVAHAAPFMGAQTTNMQRHFLPHPLDTIISQPFGMSEDLLSMALAEATTNPALGSISLTLLVVGFNLARYTVFTSTKDKKACATAVLNFVIGLFVVYSIYSEEAMRTSSGALLALVLSQFAVQVFLSPIIARSVAEHLHEHERRKVENRTLLAENQSLRRTTTNGESQALWSQQQNRFIQELQERESDVQRRERELHERELAVQRHEREWQEKRSDVQRLESTEREFERLSSNVAQIQKAHQQYVDELRRDFNAKFALESQRHEQVLIKQQVQIEELQDAERKYASEIQEYERNMKTLQKKLDMEKFERVGFQQKLAVLQQKMEEKELKNERLTRKLSETWEQADTRPLKKKLEESEALAVQTGATHERSTLVLPAPTSSVQPKMQAAVSVQSISLRGRLVPLRRARTMPAKVSSPYAYQPGSPQRNLQKSGTLTPVFSRPTVPDFSRSTTPVASRPTTPVSNTRGPTAQLVRSTSILRHAHPNPAITTLQRAQSNPAIAILSSPVNRSTNHVFRLE